MLPSGPGDLAVDGGRAVRLAAVVALVVLGLITLPDLFRTPEPPPLPPDVGFRPGEAQDWNPASPEIPAVETGAPRSSGRADRKGRDPKRRGGTEPTAERREGKRRDEPDSPAKPSPVAAAPSPSPDRPAPSPSPPPVVPVPPVPADGSEEFAPGLAG